MRAIGVAAVVVATFVAGPADAALVISIDVDGSSTGTAVTLNPLFRLGPGTTAHGGGSIRSTAPGLPNGNSIFGGNSATKDIYEYLYTPGTNADNVAFTPGQALGNGNTATGLTGGGAGTYAAYVTWPRSTNASLSPTTYELIGPGGVVLASAQAVQRDVVGIQGNTWFKVGTALLDPGTQYVLRQTAPDSSFVSTRAAGAMFELVAPAAVPEPSSLALLGLVGAVGGVAGWRKRKAAA